MALVQFTQPANFLPIIFAGFESAPGGFWTCWFRFFDEVWTECVLWTDVKYILYDGMCVCAPIVVTNYKKYTRYKIEIYGMIPLMG